VYRYRYALALLLYKIKQNKTKRNEKDDQMFFKIHSSINSE
jgi:hypothetical protein